MRGPICGVKRRQPLGSDLEEFRKYPLADMIKWAKLVKERGAKLD